MNKSLILLVAGVLGSQVALADLWDTVGRVHLDKLGNVAGKTILTKRKFDFGITNTPDFKPGQLIINFEKDEQNRQVCRLSLIGRVEVPGVLESLYLDANSTLSLESLEYTRGSRVEWASTVRLILMTSSGTKLQLFCDMKPNDRLVTLKDLDLLLRSFFDLSSLLPKPPAGRQIMDLEQYSDDRYL